jgi:hypothetical protein
MFASSTRRFNSSCIASQGYPRTECVANDSRVAIVTGAGTGIGAEAARLLAENGKAVTLVGREQDTLEQVAGETAEQGVAPRSCPPTSRSPRFPGE